MLFGYPDMEQPGDYDGMQCATLLGIMSQNSNRSCHRVALYIQGPKLYLVNYETLH